MSDNQPKPMAPDTAKRKTAASHPMTKTSAVPIRKETVRVTLKAPPQGVTGPTAPPAPLAPSAPPVAPSPMASSAPMAPTAAIPTSPKPPVPAPTIPLKTAAPSTPVPPAPAPTVMLTGAAAGPATKLATPAPTVRLNTPTGGAGTVPLATATGAASQQLPKATVQLAQTQPMDSPASLSQAATIRTADDDDSAESGAGAVGALSVGALVAALILLGVQLATSSVWVDGEWGKLFE